jgi:hypothetical protein
MLESMLGDVGSCAMLESMLGDVGGSIQQIYSVSQ